MLFKINYGLKYKGIDEIENEYICILNAVDTSDALKKLKALRYEEFEVNQMKLSYTRVIPLNTILEHTDIVLDTRVVNSNKIL